MQKKNIKLFVIIGSIILCCFFSTIAYSALYSTMEISGMAYARPVKDVRITDFKINDSSFSSTTSYEEFSVNTISSKFKLNEPASSMIFDVEITNYGSSDVGILNLIGTLPEGLSYEIINYNLKDKLCDDAGKCNQMAVKTFQIEFSGTLGEYEVTLELDFREYHTVTYTDITNNNYPIEVMDGASLNVDFTEPLKRIAVYQNGEKVAYYPTVYQGSNLLLASVKGNIEIKQEEPVARLVSGKIDEVGSEVCIKDECFYIISNDGSTVSMLAKYNLYVGGSTDGKTYVRTEYGSEATGLQDSSMVGFSGNAQSFNGVVAYSDGSTIYSESTIKNYVNAYSVYLLGEGVSIKDARLITVTELEKLGCESSVDYTTINTGCLDSYNWLYSSTYWTQTTYDSDLVYTVMTDGQVEAGPFGVTVDLMFGVRPVIELSVDDIEIPPLAKIVSGDYDTVGSEVAIGDEHFYVISSTDDTVTMLAKYNLHVGNSVDADWNVTPLASPTGIQNVIAKGYVWDNENGDEVFPFIGTTAFSDISTDYSGSIVEGYVDNYSNYLSSLGVTLVDSRLLYSEEACSLGCELYESPGGLEGSCNSAPNFVYSTSYWIISGSSFSLGELGIINSGTVITSDISNDYDYGVRPVITISKDYF